MNNRDILASLDRLQTLPSTKTLLQAQNIEAKRKFGQNFLLNPQVTDRIAALAKFGPQDGLFVEIGPGPGLLTRSLLETGIGKLVVIEKDIRFQPILQEIKLASDHRLEILFGDALTLALGKIKSEFDPQTPFPLRIFGNLPYNIATPLLFNFLAERQHVFDMVLMFQKEVAERMIAKPSTPAYGKLSVMVQLLCQVDIVMQLPATAFTPPPKVESSLVKLTPFQATLPCDEAILQNITGLAFGQRRKMLRRSLASLTPNIQEILIKSDIDPSARGETLTPHQFVTLANIYLSHCKS